MVVSRQDYFLRTGHDLEQSLCRAPSVYEAGKSRIVQDAFRGTGLSIVLGVVLSTAVSSAWYVFSAWSNFDPHGGVAIAETVSKRQNRRCYTSMYIYIYICMYMYASPYIDLHIRASVLPFPKFWTRQFPCEVEPEADK